MAKRRPRKQKRGPRPPRPPRQRAGPRGVQEQIARLQEEMLKAQEELKEELVSATAGGGVVTAVVNGHQELQSLTIDPEAIDPEDVEILQDMILAAVNEALEKSRELAAERMSAFTGGLDISGLL